MNMPSEESYRRYVAALIAGDRHACRTELEAWLESGIDVRSLYEELFRRSLYAVGTLWERSRISVATEHLATAITESLLNLVYPRLFNRTPAGRSAVVACTVNEYHQIGGKMVADIFELHGWRGYFLGPDVPKKDLLALIAEKRPDAVSLSLTLFYNLTALLETARAIRAAFPSLPVLVGGQGFRHGGRERAEQIPGVRHIASLADLEAWIESEWPHAC